MTRDIILSILWFILIILWLIGCFVPVLAGPLLSYLWLIALQIAFDSFSMTFLVVSWIIMTLVSILDNIIPVVWTKKMWGSKWWVRWSMIGLIIAIIILPMMWIVIWPFGLFGLIWWPFIGAWIGEYMHRQDREKSFKPAMWAFLGFLAGILLKLIVSLVFTYYFVVEIIVQIKAGF